MRRTTSALFATASLLLVGACNEDDTAGPGPPPDGTVTLPTVPDGTVTLPTVPPTSVDGELPGERIEIFPYEGATLGAMGVDADDELAVRSGPGEDFDAVAHVTPLADDLTATGHNRTLEDSGMWSEVEVGETVGWIESGSVAHLGQTTDITSELAPTPAELPRVETMLRLGEVVGDLRATTEPPSTVVVVDGPTVGDLGEVTVDVVGMGDDALAGERLHVFATPNPDGETFTVRTVEATLLCARGVTDDGLCV